MELLRAVSVKSALKNKRRTLKTVAILLGILTSLDLLAQPFFPVRVNKEWGAIDSTGKIVLKPAYEDLHVQGENSNFIIAEKGDSTFLINSRFQIIARTVYASIIERGEGMFETRLRSERYYPSFFGLMDSTGKVIVEPVFSSMEPFNDGLSKVNIYIDTTDNFKRENERSGLIDKMGNWIIASNYLPDHIKSSSDSLINFYEKGRGWGAMDLSTNIVIEPKYLWLGPCKYGYMEYSMNDYCSGLMKKNGKITLPEDGRMRVSYRPQSPTDTLVVVHRLKIVRHSALPARSIDGKIHTVNGKFLYTAEYGSQCSQQCNGFFQVSNQERKRGMMNSSGKIVAPPIYGVLQWFQPGLKQVERNGKWGFIDDNGNEIIPCVYDDTKQFKNGLAAVYMGGKWSDYIFPDKYPNVKMGYINSRGQVIWNPSW